MTVDTSYGVPMEGAVFQNYVRSLVNKFFKILPIREQEDENLKTYMESLQCELIGCRSLIAAVNADPLYMSMLCLLQSLIDHADAPVSTFRREVFKAISICNKLKSKYATAEEG